ncbi:response regulator transcription factor [Rhizobium sp. BK602]|uniref:LuxR C-terminal-related transcriptional regulator n=1 Tax=Rhizobium sp. BK602 TaxID=2586986 RepID=UPI0016221B53|nr:response regulator transcription factor [Rhizobium sp. BK602]MBB3610681.1 two-component system nitrate/nitrite response regulator NarL [Rhizobium sp. BK602]
MLSPAYIFDSSRLFREGARLILRLSSFDVVGMGETLEDLHELPRMEPLAVCVIGTVVDVAVLDFVTAVLAINPNARVVVLADVYNHDEAAAILDRGAKGYLHKGLSSESFVKALQLISEECSVISGWSVSHGSSREDSRTAALSDDKPGSRSLTFDAAASFAEKQLAPGDVVVCPDAGSGVFDVHEHDTRMAAAAVQVTKVANGVRNLSPREKSILKLVMGGESNKQIARRLEITESTVKVHIKTILRKIDARNRTQAAIWAMADPDFLEFRQHS